MIKKLPGTSYRALAIALVAILLFILLIAYDIWTGVIHSGHYGGSYKTRWASNPVTFSVLIGLQIALAAVFLLVWYVNLLSVIRAHRKRLPGADKRL